MRHHFTSLAIIGCLALSPDDAVSGQLVLPTFVFDEHFRPTPRPTLPPATLSKTFMTPYWVFREQPTSTPTSSPSISYQPTLRPSSAPSSSQSWKSSSRISRSYMTADGSVSSNRILLTIFLALSTITILLCLSSERSEKSPCLPLFRSEEKQTTPSTPQDWSDWFSSFWSEEPKSPPPPSKLKRTISSSSLSRHSDAKSTQIEATSKRKGRNKKDESKQRSSGEVQDSNSSLCNISALVPFGQEQNSSRDKRNIKNRLSFDRDDSSIISRKRRRRHDSNLEPTQRPSSRQGILMKITKAKQEEPKAESWSEALTAFNVFGNGGDQQRTEDSSNTSIVKRKIIKAKPEQPKTESWGEALTVFNMFSNESEHQHNGKILKRKMTGAVPKVLVITEKKKPEKKSQKLANEGGIHQIIGQIVPINENNGDDSVFGSFALWLEDKSRGVYSSSSSSYEDDEESLFSNLSLDSSTSAFSIESITWE